jgi:hypothetical protein
VEFAACRLPPAPPLRVLVVFFLPHARRRVHPIRLLVGEVLCFGLNQQIQVADAYTRPLGSCVMAVVVFVVGLVLLLPPSVYSRLQ